MGNGPRTLGSAGGYEAVCCSLPWRIVPATTAEAPAIAVVSISRRVMKLLVGMTFLHG